MQFNQYAIQDFLGKPTEKINFHIDRLEQQIERPSTILSPHKHLFHELFFVEQGETINIVDFNEFVTNENTLAFIVQGQLHFRGESSRNIKGFRLMFNADFLWALQPYHQFLFDMVHLGTIYQSPKIQIKAEIKNKFNFYFENLLTEYQKVDSQLALGSLLYLLLLEIQKQLELENASSVSEQTDLNLFRKFTEMADQKFNQNWTIQQYADALQVSISKLSKSVHLVANDSVLNIIQNRILLESKRFLIFSDLSVSEISYKLGIKDASYFARLFKKHENVTPTEFKLMNIKKYR